MSKLTAVFAACAVLCAQAWAAEPAGTVKSVKGSASIEREGKRLPLAAGDRVLAKDRVVTGADGAVGITLRDNTLLSAGPNSTLTLEKFAFDSTTHTGALDATLKRGTLAVVSGKLAKSSPDAVIFRTPSTTLGVRGTEFVIEAADRGDR